MVQPSSFRNHIYPSQAAFVSPGLSGNLLVLIWRVPPNAWRCPTARPRPALPRICASTKMYARDSHGGPTQVGRRERHILGGLGGCWVGGRAPRRRLNRLGLDRLKRPRMLETEEEKGATISLFVCPKKHEKGVESAARGATYVTELRFTRKITRATCRLVYLPLCLRKRTSFKERSNLALIAFSWARLIAFVRSLRNRAKANKGGH